MNEYTGTSLQDGGSTYTAGETQNHCGWCSNPPLHYVYHYGPCDRLKAREYHRDGSLKRVEFHPTPLNVVVGEPFEAAKNADDPFKRWPSPPPWEFVIEEDTLLESGRYTVIDGELRRVVDESPPGLSGEEA